MKTKTYRQILAAMLALVCLFGLAACGGKTEPATTEAPAAAETTEAPAATAAAEAAPDAKHFTIASDTVFVPFEYQDETGTYVGVDVDLLAAIAEDQGFTYDINFLGWDAAIAACQAGQADGMIAGASIKQERIDNGWIFSDGYFNASQSMAVAANSGITGFADLNGKTVAAKTGTEGAAYAESLKDENGFSITYFEDSATMYQAVLGGQAVACFEDTPVLETNIKVKGLAMEIPDGCTSDGAPYGFAIFNPANQELIDLFNAGLKNVQANGKYDEIIAKYFG